MEAGGEGGVGVGRREGEDHGGRERKSNSSNDLARMEKTSGNGHWTGALARNNVVDTGTIEHAWSPLPGTVGAPCALEGRLASCLRLASNMGKGV